MQFFCTWDRRNAGQKHRLETVRLFCRKGSRCLMDKKLNMAQQHLIAVVKVNFILELCY